MKLSANRVTPARREPQGRMKLPGTFFSLPYLPLYFVKSVFTLRLEKCKSFTYLGIVRLLWIVPVVNLKSNLYGRRRLYTLYTYVNGFFFPPYLSHLELNRMVKKIIAHIVHEMDDLIKSMIM